MRVMITLFETFENKYKYSDLIVYIEDIDDSKAFQELCFKYGFSWICGDETYFLDVLRPKSYLLISLFRGKISIGAGLDNLYTYLSMAGRDWDKTIYSRKDFNMVENILRLGQSAPSYAPRRIDRTLERFENKYKYEIIIVRVDNSEESEKFQRLFFDHEIYWYSGNKEPLYLDEDFPDYLEVTLGEPLSSLHHRVSISHGNNEPHFERWIDVAVDKHIYTIDDYDKVKNILEHGRPIYEPSYAPRRIDRTLESVNTNKKIIDSNISRLPYNFLLITQGASGEVPMEWDQQNLIDISNQYKGYLDLRDIQFGMSPGSAIYLSLCDDIRRPGGLILIKLKGYSATENFFTRGEFMRDFINAKPKVITQREFKNELKKIFQATPNYSPRRIDRTLEAVEHLPYRYKTEEEFVKEFGDDWRQRVMTNWVSPGMDELFGQDFPYTKAEMVKNNISSTRDSFWLVTISRGCQYNVGMDMLTENKPKEPSYAPRRIDRTLESITQYPYRFKTEEELIKEFGWDWCNNAFPEVGWNSQLPLGEESHRFVDEDGEDWLICWDMLTPNKPKVPDYSPRRIERTLEAVKPYPYRFKTEEEFEKEFGDRWRDRVTHSWGSPGMDCLFGVDYPYFLSKEEESDDELPNVVMEDEYEDDNGDYYSDGEWMISWDMLTPIRPLVPNYNPRRIDRTLESINEGYWYEKEELMAMTPNNNLPKYLMGDTVLLRSDADKIYSKIFSDWGLKPYELRFIKEFAEKPLKIVRKFHPNPKLIDDKNQRWWSAFHCDYVDEGIQEQEIWFLDECIKPYAPSYAPRRIDRTVESVGNNKWEEIVFETNNLEEAERVISVLKIKGYEWVTTEHERERIDTFPYYIFARFSNKRISSMTLVGSHSFATTIEKYVIRFNREFGKYSLNPTVFKSSDVTYIESIERTGGIEPSYAPRRIIKESVSNKYYYRFKTEKEFEKAFGSNWRNKIGLWWAPDKGMDYLLGTKLEVDFPDFVDEVSIPNRNPDVDVRHWDIQRSMLVKELVKPSYAPRKIDRTLESINTNFVEKSSYKGFIFKVNNEDELKKLIEFFYKNYQVENYETLDQIILEISDIFNSDDFYVGGYIAIDFGIKHFLIFEKEELESYIDIFELDPEVYTVGNLSKFGLEPNYKPRKISREI